MNKGQESDQPPVSAPAPQLPNIPISPDDPFQQDPDQLPPVTIPPDPDPDSAPGRQSPRGRPSQRPRRNDPDDPDVI